jgi:hypothetical protein
MLPSIIVAQDSVEQAIPVRKLSAPPPKSAAARILEQAAKKAPATKSIDTNRIKAVLQSGMEMVDTTPAITVVDSAAIKDSLQRVDSIRLVTAAQAKAAALAKKPKTWQQDTLHNKLFKLPAMGMQLPAIYRVEQWRTLSDGNLMFYFLVGVVALLAFIKVTFGKYFSSLLSLVFQTSFRQKQTRDQLAQDTLPGLFMNILFVLVAGLFISLATLHYGWVQLDFWWLLLYASLGLAAVYITKHLFILFSGWVFNEREAARSYGFVVGFINKLLGLALLPLVLPLAFASGNSANILLAVAYFVCGLLLFYRYTVAISVLRGQLKINVLYFFLYFCTVEALPLIVMYKAFINQVG